MPDLPPVSQIDRAALDRTILSPSPDVQGTGMEGETVLLDLSTGRYYTLNRLGGVIWDLCDGQRTVRDVHKAICDRFDVMPERALEDLLALAEELVQEKVLQMTKGGE